MEIEFTLDFFEDDFRAFSFFTLTHDLEARGFFIGMSLWWGDLGFTIYYE